MTLSAEEPRAQMPGGRAHPVDERRAVHRHAVACEELALAIQGQVFGELRNEDMRDQRLVGRPPSIRCAGAGAWATPARPFGQA
jgi:hypothetical protein